MRKIMVTFESWNNKAPLKEARKALQAKYAWPGGYPLYAVMSDGAPICCDCALKEWKQIYRSTVDHAFDGWRLEGVGVNWEDPALFCDRCNTRIESANAEDRVEYNLVSSLYMLSLSLTKSDIESASHQGDCDADVKALCARKDIASQTDKWDPEKLKRELKEYGAWDEIELSDHDANIRRLVWILAGDERESWNE